MIARHTLAPPLETLPLRGGKLLPFGSAALKYFNGGTGHKGTELRTQTAGRRVTMRRSSSRRRGKEKMAVINTLCIFSNQAKQQSYGVNISRIDPAWSMERSER